MTVTMLGFYGVNPTAQKRSASQAVVIVPGGDATSPYHSADEAFTGPAAGNTDTALREFLLKQGYTVFTSPAMAGRGQVVDQTGFGSFGVCPVTLLENMTVNSTGSIDTAGEHLARFPNWLHTERRASPRSISSPIPWAGCTPALPSGCSPPPTPR